MKKAITLPQFVKDFPKNKCFVKEEYFRPNNIDFDYNKDLTYAQKIQYVGCVYKGTTRLSATDDCVYYVVSTKRLCRRGKTFYPKEDHKETIYIGKNNISFRLVSNKTLFDFLKILEIDWFRDIDSNILCQGFFNKTIFRRLITNRIYNEETLYKSIATCTYGIKDISWKTVRKYYELKYGSEHLFGAFIDISLTDLYYFTKNVDQSVNILINNAFDTSKYSDLIKSAVQLDQVVDLAWSAKRIEEEHKRQTETLMAKQLGSKKVVPIYDISTIEFPFRLLNTEKDVFIEGTTMHHCLYNCYYDRIKNHDYIAFHLDSPEDCTLGIWKYDGKPALNQIYKKYDQRVSDETRKYAEDFIKSHEDDLMKLFNQKVKENEPLNCTIENLPFWDVELPY